MIVTQRFFLSSAPLLVLISMLSQPVVAADLYKWVDSMGKVTYQSSPPPDGALDVVKSQTDVVVDEEAEAAPVFETDPVKFYTKPECPTCNDARAYFEEMQIPFEEVDISENTVAAEKMEKNFGHNNVPTLKVGNKSITGYEKDTIEKILKNAGYNIPTAEGEAPAEVVEAPAEAGEAPAEADEASAEAGEASAEADEASAEAGANN